MISSEVHRTLVKSPPELWAELGDPASLARHLGELGEIRITRIEPEEAIEWEAEDTTGTVRIKPSGWGTKVTLTVTREMPRQEVPVAAQPPAEDQGEAPPAAEAESEPTAQAAGTMESQPEPTVPAVVEPTVLAAPEPVAQAEPEPVAQAEPEPIAEVDVAGERWAEQPPDAAVAVAEPSDPDAELVPRRGFFSRLFGRRQRQAIVATAPQPAEPYATVAGSEQQPPEAYETVWNVEPLLYETPEPVARAEPEPPAPAETVAHTLEQPTEAWETVAYAESLPADPWTAVFDVEPPTEPEAAVAEQIHEPLQNADAQQPESSIALEQAEQAAAGEVTAVLTAVLDRLGAAHHRPFSRG